MAQPHRLQQVKLIAGMIAREPTWFDRAAEELEHHFGPVELSSSTFPFDFTDYYEREMGKDLKRRFVCFERPVDPATLADAKLTTNAIEARLADSLEAEVARPVNIDPGYVSEAKLVLASAKDFSHRIYLRDGIFAETTLHYSRDGRWLPWPWTFPDFKSERYHPFLIEVRERLRRELRGPA